MACYDIRVVVGLALAFVVVGVVVVSIFTDLEIPTHCRCCGQDVENGGNAVRLIGLGFCDSCTEKLNQTTG